MEKVLTGMSGGVDSSVTALFLKEQGYDVKGVTFRLYTKSENTCCSDQAVFDAAKVCEKLGIEHYTSDFQKDFEEKVVNYFVDEYLKGLTPNPCVECNKHIKFKHLLDEADRLGAKYVSTGHYCNIEIIDGCWCLVESEDQNKDQTYFLYPLKEEWLKRILFPLGKIKKTFVREKASKNGLDRVKDKKDSFEICFVPNSYKDFMKSIVGEKKGDVLLWPDNKKIGTHSGIYNFTIGQSRGLNISWNHKLFVKNIDAVENKVYVSSQEHLFSKGFILKDCNIFSIFKKRMSKDKIFGVKIRHYSSKLDAYISDVDYENNTLKVMFREPVKAITPGQSAVCYDNGVIMFGGVIDKVI